MRTAHDIVASVVLFACLMGVAIAAYPGGTWMDRAADGFHPIESFVCDLLAPVALNGRDNRFGSRAAAAAMIILTAGIGLAFWHVPLLRWKRAVRWLGLLSMPGLVLVPISGPHHWLHAVAVFIGGVPAMIAAGLCVLATRSKPRLFAVGVSMILVFAVEIAIYGEYLTRFGDPPLLLPVLQRPAVLLLMTWLLAIAMEIERARRE